MRMGWVLLAHLDVSCLLTGRQLLGQLLHRGLAGYELAHNKMQQRGPPVCPLHIGQLQQRVQLEPWEQTCGLSGSSAWDQILTVTTTIWYKLVQKVSQPQATSILI